MKAVNLIFLKLGGSLITDKTQPLTPCPEIINAISAEIACAIAKKPDLQLVIGHGSGSFGHAVASQYQTQSGGCGRGYWQGFAEVWRAARELDQILIDSLSNSGLPIIAFPPSAGIIAESNTIQSWDTRPLQLAISHGLIPLVQGDVIFDTAQGGTIFSTEQVFQYLAKTLQPQKILLAGLDSGVYHNPEQPENIISHISPGNIKDVLPLLSGARAADVTGGMLNKVQRMLLLIKEIPSLQVQIFSGAEPGNIQKSLIGEQRGTLITA